MLFGTVIKPKQVVGVDSQQGTLLHLSQACLYEPQGSRPSYLQLINGESTITLCSLSKDKCEHTSFDLFVPTAAGIKLTVSGTNEIHVAGYFEPDGDTGDSGFDESESEGEAEEASDGEEEEEVESMMATAKALPAKKLSAVMPQKAQKKGTALAKILEAAGGGEGKKGGKKVVDEAEDEGSDDDDDDDDDITGSVDAATLAQIMKQAGSAPESSGGDGDDGGDSDDDDDDKDIDDSDMDTEAVMKAVAAARKQQQQQQGVKRKTPPAPATQEPPKKQAKKNAKKEDESPATKPTAAAASGGGDTMKYQTSLTEYIKAHGRTSISQLGGQVKRPATVKKLGTFIKERPNIFKVESGFVSLVK